MCRSFHRLLQGLSIRVHSLEASQQGRHTSLIIPEFIPVARTRSLAPIHNAHHAAHWALRFSPCPAQSVAQPLNPSRPVSRRAYSQDLGRKPRYLDPEDMVRATETPGPEAKPADILNGDINLPAGQAEAALDPESDEDIPVDAEELKEALGRPPPVNSSYLPLPWKGRLGYVSCTVMGTILAPVDNPRF